MGSSAEISDGDKNAAETDDLLRDVAYIASNDQRLAKMRGEHHKVARAYVLYREERARQRAASKLAKPVETAGPQLRVKLPDGTLTDLDDKRLARVVDEACADLSDVSP